MWLTRFHLVESRDYGRIERICRASGYLTRKYPPLLLAKGWLMVEFTRKSWRDVGRMLGVPHLPLYHFAQEITLETKREIATYAIERGILVYLSDTRHVTSDDIESDEARGESIMELGKMF